MDRKNPLSCQSICQPARTKPKLSRLMEVNWRTSPLPIKSSKNLFFCSGSGPLRSSQTTLTPSLPPALWNVCLYAPHQQWSVIQNKNTTQKLRDNPHNQHLTDGRIRWKGQRTQHHYTYTRPAGISNHSSPAFITTFFPPITPSTWPSSSLIHSVLLGW